jgi:hypothetical protein
MWIFVWTHSYIRQESQFNITVRTKVSLGPKARSTVKEIVNSTLIVRTTTYHGPDVRIADMEIACWSSAIRKLIPHGLDARSLIWKLLAADVRPSGRQCLIVWTPLLNRKDFSAKFSEKSVAQLSVRTAHVHRLDGTRLYHCSCPFCSSANK